MGETAAVHMKASVGLPQTPGTEVPHAIWDAPLALSAAIYARHGGETVQLLEGSESGRNM